MMPTLNKQVSGAPVEFQREDDSCNWALLKEHFFFCLFLVLQLFILFFFLNLPS